MNVEEKARRIADAVIGNGGSVDHELNSMIGCNVAESNRAIFLAMKAIISEMKRIARQ